MFNPDDYEDLEDPSSLIVDELLPPHVKVAKVAYHYEQQEKSVITVMRLGISHGTVPNVCRPSRIKII